MNKAVIATIFTLSFCFNAFAQEAKGKDWTEEEWKKEKGSYGWVFPHIDKDADGTVTAAEYEEFQRYKTKAPRKSSLSIRRPAMRSVGGRTSLSTKSKSAWY